jgi:hypothetical protein
LLSDRWDVIVKNQVPFLGKYKVNLAQNLDVGLKGYSTKNLSVDQSNAQAWITWYLKLFKKLSKFIFPISKIVKEATTYEINWDINKNWWIFYHFGCNVNNTPAKKIWDNMVDVKLYNRDEWQQKSKRSVLSWFVWKKDFWDILQNSFQKAFF